MLRAEFCFNNPKRPRLARSLENLPHDLVINILHQLPVRSLLRFRCVCNSWRNVIASRAFALEHYNTTASKEDHIFFNKYPSRPYSFDYIRFREHRRDEAYSLVSMNPNHTVDMVSEFEAPFLHCSVRRYICNGVICFHSPKSERLILWNPAIKEHHVLPGFPNDGKGVDTWGVGFGLVPKTNEFMVVRISGSNIHHPSKVHVYTQGSNIWRSINPNLLPVNHSTQSGWNHSGEYARGMYYWRAIEYDGIGGEKWRLLSFDMDSELFHWIDLPEILKNSCSQVYKLRESIAILYRQFTVGEVCFHVWLRTGDQFNGSWIKQYVFKPGRIFYGTPKLLWGSGIFYYTDNVRGLVYLDFDSGKKKTIRGVVYHDDIIMSVYTESLFSVKP